MSASRTAHLRRYAAHTRDVRRRRGRPAVPLPGPAAGAITAVRRPPAERIAHDGHAIPEPPSKQQQHLQHAPTRAAGRA